MNMHGLIMTLNEPTNCMRSECCVRVLDKTSGVLQGDPLRQTPFMMNKKTKKTKNKENKKQRKKENETGII